VKDFHIDYKEEALKTFVDLIEGKVGGEEGKSTYEKIRERIGETHTDNVLGTFALEYAECRGNLNKEQGFFYTALY